MTRRIFVLIMACVPLGLCAQDAAPAAKPAVAPKASAAPVHKAAPASLFDQVLKLVKAKMPEALVLKTIQSSAKPPAATSDQLIQLKAAGASDNIIMSMSGMNAVVTPAPAAAPAPATTAPAPEPVVAAAPPAATPPPPAAAAGPKKRSLAIFPFDYSTVRTAVAAVFKTDQDIGRGIQAMMVTRLSKDGKLTLVERSKVDTLMKEQDFSSSNRVKQGTGPKIGRIRGADAMLLGDIVAFGRDDRKVSAAGGGIIGRGIGGVGAMMKHDKAVVVIDFRLVDAETSEIILTGEARGESERKSKGLGALAGALGAGVAGVQIDMTSSNFAETIIGEATMDAVTKLAAQMNDKVAGLPAKKIEVEGRVANVSGGKVMLNVGTNNGVNVGDRFEIGQIIKEIKDPATQEVLDLDTRKIGELVITEVKDRVAIGAYTGGTAPKNNDYAKKL